MIDLTAPTQPTGPSTPPPKTLLTPPPNPISGIFYAWVAFTNESNSVMVSTVLGTFVVLFISVVINVNNLFSLPEGVLDHGAGVNNQTPLLQGGGGNVYHGR